MCEEAKVLHHLSLRASRLLVKSLYVSHSSVDSIAGDGGSGEQK